MSSDDPSDDAMDAEFARDASGGPYAAARHAPKLSTVSRAINPRALLSAEADGQQRDDQYAPAQGRVVSPGVVAYTAQAEDPYGGRVPFRPNTTLPRGMPAVAPPPRREGIGRFAPGPQQPPPVNEDARAWDAYAAAALQTLMAQHDATAPELGEYAAAFADALLEARRRRFPA